MALEELMARPGVAPGIDPVLGKVDRGTRSSDEVHANDVEHREATPAYEFVDLAEQRRAEIGFVEGLFRNNTKGPIQQGTRAGKNIEFRPLNIEFGNRYRRSRSSPPNPPAISTPESRLGLELELRCQGQRTRVAPPVQQPHISGIERVGGRGRGTDRNPLRRSLGPTRSDERKTAGLDLSRVG